MSPDKNRYFARALRGFVDAIIIILIYVHLFPLIIQELYIRMGQNPPDITFTSTYFAVLVVIIGLSSFARIFESTIFEPILKASASMLGVLYALSFIGDGTITVKNINVSDYLLDISIDLGPIMILFFAFFVAPSVVMPFIDYYVKNK